MARVMIFGGGGFIGSHITKRCVEAGHEVFSVDMEFPAWRQPNLRGARLISGDLRTTLTGDLLEAYNPRYLFQFAADMGGVEYFHSSRDWAAAADNGLINHQVLSTCGRMTNPPRVLFTSTACAYATEHQMTSQAPQLVEEDVEWGTPDQLYGQEKRNSTLMYLGASFDARVAALHTVYGPMQEHAGIRMKFPSAVAQKARRSRETKKLEMFGDGNQIRSYLYIDDAADRLMSLMFKDFDASPGLVNVGSDQPFTCLQVAKQALAVAHGKINHEVEISYIPGPVGVRSRNCSNQKAKRFLDFSREPTGLTLGFQKFISWLDQVDPVEA